MRRIKKVRVKRLALCREAKNGLQTLYKSDGSLQLETLTKSDLEKGELLAVAWVPDAPDPAEGHWADRGVVEDMCRTFLEEGAQLDIEHDGAVLAKSAVSTIESFIVQPGDARFANWKNYDGTPVDVTGGWAVRLKINDPALREQHRNGDLNGVSLFGPAEVEKTSPESAAQRVSARLTKSNRMTPEQLAALQAAIEASQTKSLAPITSALETLVKALTPVESKEQGKAEELKKSAAPVFSGDASDPAALEAFARELDAFQLNEQITSGKLSPAQILAKAKELGSKQPSDSEAEIEPGDSPEVRRLKVELYKAKGRSSVPEGNGSPAPSKEELLRKSRSAEADALAKVLASRQGLTSQS